MNPTCINEFFFYIALKEVQQIHSHISIYGPDPDYPTKSGRKSPLWHLCENSVRLFKCFIVSCHLSIQLFLWLVEAFVFPCSVTFQPTLEFDTPILDFGVVPVRTSQTLKVPITNHGVTSLLWKAVGEITILGKEEEKYLVEQFLDNRFHYIL